MAQSDVITLEKSKISKFTKDYAVMCKQPHDFGVRIGVEYKKNCEEQYKWNITKLIFVNSELLERSNTNDVV